VSNGRASKGRRKKEAKRMNYYVGFDPYTIMERNRQVRDEVRALYLEERLQKNRKARDPLLTPSVKQGKHFVGRARLSQ
jgi:hypothetical protein